VIVIICQMGTKIKTGNQQLHDIRSSIH